MALLQTNIDLLNFEKANANNIVEISETELTHYLNTIHTGINRCNEHYQIQLIEDNENVMILRDEIYESFMKELENIFEKATRLESNIQLKLIEQIQYDLTCETNQIFGKAFMSYFDDTFQNIVIKLMITKNHPIEESKKMKQSAYQFLNHVYKACKPFEAMTWIIERVYDLNWLELQQDIDNDHENDRMETIFTFIILIKSFGQSVIQQTKKLNHLVEFFNNMVNTCRSPLSFLEKIMNETHDKNLDVWELQITNIISCILDAIEIYHVKISEYKSDREEKLLESARYLLVLVFDKFVLNCNMNLSKKYYDQFHPRYNISATIQNRNTTNDDTYTLTDSPPMNDLIHRCLTLLSQLGCSFDKLLYLRKLNLDKNDIGDNYEINYSSELSLNGILSILALSIYDTCRPSTSASSRSLLPIAIDPIWIGKHCIGYLMNLVGNPDDISKIDKAILVLLFLSDNVDNAKLKINLNTMEQKFNGIEKEVTLSEAFQIFTSVTSMTKDATLRFLGYQLIDQLINLSLDETRLYLLTELLENCPYPTMKTASIGLLKNQITHSQQQLNNNNNKRNVFNSRIIVDKFIPIIFNERNTLVNDKDQNYFWDTFSYHMQALNFYYYLLSWDKNNQTTVKDKDQIDWMQKIYLEPLMKQYQGLITLYQNETLNNETNGPKLFQLNLLEQIVDDIKKLILNINKY
ncbi:unnamed protein product [Cunninghamella blakesleeana]